MAIINIRRTMTCYSIPTPLPHPKQDRDSGLLNKRF